MKPFHWLSNESPVSRSCLLCLDTNTNGVNATKIPNSCTHKEPWRRVDNKAKKTMQAKDKLLKSTDQKRKISRFTAGSQGQAKKHGRAKMESSTQKIQFTQTQTRRHKGRQKQTRADPHPTKTLLGILFFSSPRTNVTQWHFCQPFKATTKSTWNKKTKLHCTLPPPIQMERPPRWNVLFLCEVLELNLLWWYFGRSIWHKLSNLLVSLLFTPWMVELVPLYNLEPMCGRTVGRPAYIWSSSWAVNLTPVTSFHSQHQILQGFCFFYCIFNPPPPIPQLCPLPLVPADPSDTKSLNPPREKHCFLFDPYWSSGFFFCSLIYKNVILSHPLFPLGMENCHF